MWEIIMNYELWIIIGVEIVWRGWVTLGEFLCVCFLCVFLYVSFFMWVSLCEFLYVSFFMWSLPAVEMTNDGVTGWLLWGCIMWVSLGEFLWVSFFGWVSLGVFLWVCFFGCLFGCVFGCVSLCDLAPLNLKVSPYVESNWGGTMGFVWDINCY